MKQLSKLVWSTTAAFALVVAMGATSPAAAQGKQEFAAGYQFQNMSAGGGSTSFPAGWFFDAGFPISFPNLSIVGSVDGSYKSETILTTDVSKKVHTFMGGIRYSMKASGMMTPFGQFLVGAASTSASAGGTSASNTDGAIDIGGGINWGLNDKWALRLGIDYRRIMGTVGTNDFRFVAGVILPIGK